MSIDAAIDCVWTAEAKLGEGPTWDARTGSLFWVDIKGGLLHAYDPSNRGRITWRPEHRIFSLDTPPKDWIAPAQGVENWFIGCAACGFGWIGLDGASVLFHPLAHPESGMRQNRYNDGKTGPDGRYWAGSMHDGESEASGSLYAFVETGDSDRIDTGYVVSNGPAFSPDGRTLYHTDSALRAIYAFDLGADGGVSNRRVFVRFDEEDGYPDGMTTDHEGNLWIAMWDRARLQKLSPSGTRLGHIPMPTTRPTSCTFSAPSTLFVTSASMGAPAEDRLAGGLFRVDLR